MAKTLVLIKGAGYIVPGHHFQRGVPTVVKDDETADRLLATKRFEEKKFTAKAKIESEETPVHEESHGKKKKRG